MPEGPEVKIVVDQLKARVVGKKINWLAENGGRYKTTRPIGESEFLDALNPDGLLIKNVEAKGKFIYWTLQDDWSIWNTLGMSGTWSMEKHKHTALSFQIGPADKAYDALNDEYVRFVDMRHFGTLKFVKGKEALVEKLQTIGWDWLDRKHSVTAIWWYFDTARKELKEKPIGVILMDQSIFAGVGNYLRAEILYQARISPWRKLKDITYDELKTICEATHEIMLNSYNSNGATISTYKDVNGHSGEYTSRFAVYNRKTDPFGNVVTREQTTDKRTIHWVPELQK